MAILTLQAWNETVALGLVKKLPLQNIDSAFALSQNYLANNGGWIPDDPGEPIGFGSPATGETLEQAIQSIFNQQIAQIYTADITGSLTFNITLNKNLAVGLSDSDVFFNVEADLSSIIEEQLKDTSLEIVAIPSFSGTISTGATDTVERVGLQALLTSGGKLSNPKAIALSSARAEFNLDNTHNVRYLYTESGKEYFVSIVKYTDTTYSTVDQNATKEYSIRLNRLSYKVFSGTINKL